MTADVARNPQAVAGRRYANVAIVLHWLIAFGILFQVSLAWRFKDLHTPEGFALTQLHKSVGITILLLSLARLAWRLINPPPPLPADMAAWEKGLAHVVHWGLYAIMIGMPLTGWLMVSASRITVPTLLYGVIPWPNIPGVAGLAPAAKHAWRSIGSNGHGLLAWGFYGLFVLHVAGALKHQLFSRDEPVLGRMAPGAVAGRWFDWRLMLIGLLVLGAVAFGKLVNPPAPGMGPPPVPASQQDAAPPAAAPPPQAQAASPSAPAAPLAAAAPPPAAAPTGPVHWTVQPGSALGFATAWSGQALQGRFKRWTADIVFSPDALDRSKVSVSIDLTSAETGDAQRDAVLPSPDWFDAGAHPKAVFTATRFEKAGADRYVAHGTLALRGVTKPVDLPFKLTITGDQAQVSGQASLDRTVFGVGQGEFAATDQVPAKVAVSVALKARRAGG
ncbi:MAG: cytochrome B [Phenylobacterium sp.]|nr:MAG: cytochrome B [Phenylobacterium sp.]